MIDKCCLRQTSEENRGGHPSAGVDTFPSTSDSSPTEQENLSQIRMGVSTPSICIPKGRFRLGGEAFASIAYVHGRDRAEPCWASLGQRMRERLRWDRAASPSAPESLPDGSQEQEMAAPGRTNEYLHFQTEESSPSPAGKSNCLLSVMLKLKGAEF